MPNHCTNVLHIDGELKYRQEFVDKNKGFGWGDKEKKGDYYELSFHAQVPMPQKHIRNASNIANNDWYVWANKNWGTKWDCYEIRSEHTDRYTHYTFTTAWSPPDEWVLKVSKKFPHLKFNVEWVEEGGEGGAFMIQRGVLRHVRAFSQDEVDEFNGE